MCVPGLGLVWGCGSWAEKCLCCPWDSCWDAEPQWSDYVLLPGPLKAFPWASIVSAESLLAGLRNVARAGDLLPQGLLEPMRAVLTALLL